MRKQRRPKRSARPRPKTEPRRLSRDPEFVSGVAALLPAEDKGNTKVAEQVLWDLETRYPKAARLTNEQLLSAIRKAKRKDTLELDRVVLQVRKLVYGYTGNPDEITEVLTPTGGKP